MSHPKSLKPLRLVDKKLITDAELKLLVEEYMNTPARVSVTQIKAAERLKEQNKQAARELLLRMQLGLKTRLSSNGNGN